jgi:hypothetical protein
MSHKPQTIKLDPQAVDHLFERCINQFDVYLGLLRMVYPNWDRIEAVGTWPKTNTKTSNYLHLKFINFDRWHHPDVLMGGLWMNKGFEVDDSLADWEVHQSPYALRPPDYHPPRICCACGSDQKGKKVWEKYHSRVIGYCCGQTHTFNKYGSAIPRQPHTHGTTGGGVDHHKPGNLQGGLK